MRYKAQFEINNIYLFLPTHLRMNQISNKMGRKIISCESVSDVNRFLNIKCLPNAIYDDNHHYNTAYCSKVLTWNFHYNIIHMIYYNLSLKSTKVVFHANLHKLRYVNVVHIFPFTRKQSMNT